jgi:hypothetical protein
LLISVAGTLHRRRHELLDKFLGHGASRCLRMLHRVENNVREIYGSVLHNP